MEEQVCFCGHPESEHYVYCLNGKDQWRCRGCCPHKLIPKDVTLVETTTGSKFDQMDKAADHKFRASPARNN
jgi:hypothetical protein